MAILVVDHHLKDFDAWLKVFSAHPPPAIGSWRVTRGTDDPNRVQVTGEMKAGEVEAVKAFIGSEEMQAVFARVNEGSVKPVEFIWLEDVTPG